jgi:anthranilate phosphoribosyltransferase
MTDNMKPILAKVADGETLSTDEAANAFNVIMSGEAQESQIGAFLMALRQRGETVDEITGAVTTMRAKAVKINAPDDAMDIVGTGGDGVGTYNISTGAALVVAGFGVPIAKHGNRAASSKTGTADVLTTLGVNLDADFPLIEQSIVEAGIGFMMAPRHHSAMRFVGPVRAALGLQTIFNILGPLANPAGVKRQFSGVFAKKWAVPMAESLKNLGSDAAWVVHGNDGLDELTTTAPSFVAELKDGTVSTFEVSPEDAGLPLSKLEDLLGGDGTVNAAAITDLLDGNASAYRDAVLFNASASLLVAGKVDSLKDGVAVSAESIDSGKAKAGLAKLIQITNSPS